MSRREVLSRRIRLLVAATITYNVIEAVIALAAGTRASSMALIGFGLDSVVEVSSAAVVAWQFADRDRTPDLVHVHRLAPEALRGRGQHPVRAAGGEGRPAGARGAQRGERGQALLLGLALREDDLGHAGARRPIGIETGEVGEVDDPLGRGDHRTHPPAYESVSEH